MFPAQGRADSVARTARHAFVGRASELATLDEAWAGARSGELRAVGVEGPSGIGKSALIHRFLDDAGARGASEPGGIVVVGGDEAETDLPWGLFDQLRRALEPAAGADLGADLGADPGADPGRPSGGDPVYAGHALAQDLAHRGPTIVVIDDAHLADRLSLVAVRVAVRRLLTSPVLVVLAYEAAPLASGAMPAVLDDGWRRLLDSPRGRVVPLAGLPASDLVSLASAVGRAGLSPAGAARLHAHTSGHPLHAGHVLAQVSLRALAFGEGPLPAPLGLSARIRTALAACSPVTREFLGAAAVLGRSFAASSAIGLVDGAGPSSAEAAVPAGEAIDAGLIAEVPGSGGAELAFTGALVRDAVLLQLDPETRRALHRRAAATGGRSAVHHRVAAASGPDPEVASQLQDVAAAALADGDVPTAAAAWRHSLGLTAPGPDRRARLLATVECLLVIGDIAATEQYAGELEALTGDDVDYVRGYRALLLGDLPAASAQLQVAFQGADLAGDDDLAARAATLLSLIGLITVVPEQMIGFGAIAVARAGRPWVASFAAFARAVGLAVAGSADVALEELKDAGGPGSRCGLDGLVARGMVRLWTDDPAGAHADLTRALARAVGGEPLRIGQALGFLGETEYRLGLLDEAVLHTATAVGDAEENDRVWDFAMLHGQAAYPLAARGEFAAAEVQAEQAVHWARRVAAPAGLVYAAAACAAIALARRDDEWLLALALELDPVYPSPQPGTHLLGPVLAEAYALLGRVGEAEVALKAFCERLPVPAGARGWTSSTRAGIARVEALIALAEGKPDTAVQRARSALALAGGAGLRLEAARHGLLVGQCETEAGRRAAAERAYRSALAELNAMGAQAYVSLATRSAEAAGLPVGAPSRPLAVLSPGERSVASLVCQGLSNREIAQRLVLSQKTVEFHLTNAFRRLDVRTRDELRRACAQGAGAE